MHTLLLPQDRLHPHDFVKTGVVHIHDYQLYAVEKWIVDRHRQVTLLVVYTGDPTHNITLSSYTPSSSLTPDDAQAAWDRAISLLRADGAKPKQTQHGVLMVTSLAHFRSDYTIVQVPGGNFLAVKDQLYANINLLRMGCSGRTALTLEDPSDTTKERFISTYHLPETTITHSIPMPTSLESLPLSGQQPSSPQKKNPQIGIGRPSLNLPSNAWPPNQSTSSLPSRKKDRVLHGKTKERSTFLVTVLELVKLIQAGLALFGMYGSKDGMNSLVLDGLLCDDTVDGIRSWIEAVGGPCVGLEPTGRIADPMFVSGLLSLVLTVRNKLAHLGYSNQLPRDPFLYPQAFSLALASYLHSATASPSASPPFPSSTVSGATTPTSVQSQPHIFHYPYTFTSPHLSISHIAHSAPNTTSTTPLIPPAPPPANILSAAAAAAAAAVTHASSSNGAATAPSTLAQCPPTGAFLTREVVAQISQAYEAKQKTEGGKVRRVIKSKLTHPAGTNGAVGVDSDGATEGGRDWERERETERRKTLSMSLSAGEGPPGGRDSDRTQGQGTSGVGGGGPNASGIGSSGGQILTGIGSSLASGLSLAGSGLSNAGAHMHGHGDPSCLTAPTVDLPGFVRATAGASGTGGGKEKKRRKSRDVDGRARRESVDLGIGYAYTYAKDRDKEMRDGVVGGSVRALWSGRVADVVRMREWDADGVNEVNGSTGRRRGEGGKGVASDGDESYGGTGKRYDGRSTEDESDVLGGGASVEGGSSIGRAGGPSFGGMWGGRVTGKLGSWAGLGRRKHQSVDLTTTSSLNTSLRVPGRDKDTQHSSPQSQSNSPSQTQPQRLSKLIINERTTPNGAMGGTNTPSYGSPGGGRSRRPPNTRQSTGGSGAQSPTLPPMIFSGDGQDDDDMLSSGQVSPLSDYRPNPFILANGTSSPVGGGADTGNRSASGSTTNLDEQALAKLLSQNPKRPFAMRKIAQTARISSWADPISARDIDGEPDGQYEGEGEQDDDDDGDTSTHGQASMVRRPGGASEEESDISERRSTLGSLGSSLGVGGKRREKARFHSLLSVVDGEGTLIEEQMEEDSEASDDEEDEGREDEDDERREEINRRSAGFDMRRRRSFHDLDTFRRLEVLGRDQMRIDVELCGQLLIMLRREEHLRNVITCVKIVADSLSQTNKYLRTHYDTHAEALQAIDAGAEIIPQIEEATIQTDKFTQATNALQYESSQFNVSELWQAASPSRHKVFALREKVFGTGGRRLPPGVNGAHGSYNRLQWTLDGQRRLVDYLGRTEEEAEEERRIDPHGVMGGGMPEEDDDEDVVEHPGIKPMWLLRFFTSWGARWSAATSTPAPTQDPSTAIPGKDESVKSPSVSPPPSRPEVLQQL